MRMALACYSRLVGVLWRKHKMLGVDANIPAAHWVCGYFKIHTGDGGLFAKTFYFNRAVLMVACCYSDRGGGFLLAGA